MKLVTSRVLALHGKPGFTWPHSPRCAAIPGCPRSKRVYRGALVGDLLNDAAEEHP